jgi:hypothetical protein
MKGEWMTTITLGAVVLCMLLPGAALAKKGGSGNGGGGGGGGGGGEEPSNVELCASFRNASGDRLSLVGGDTVCYHSKKKYWVLLWVSNGNEGRFRMKTQGGGRYPSVEHESDSQYCTQGASCSETALRVNSLPLMTTTEFDCDSNGQNCVPSANGILDFTAMLEGEVSWAVLGESSALRWGPPTGTEDPGNPVLDCTLATPVRVERVDADNWIIEAADPYDVACGINNGAVVGHYDMPFRIEICRAGSSDCGPSDF